MKKVIGVRFKSMGKVYFFDPGEWEVNSGDGVIVETTRGVEFGDVANPPRELEDEAITVPLKSIIRVATEQDVQTRQRNKLREREAFAACAQKVSAHNLDMKLVDVEYAFTGNKIVFYFTADGRIDFRELVKDLAAMFKTRIELRQIGVRDEAKMLGGLGSCGRPVCCKSFLTDFQPVSIKMAKEQNLSLSPTKISGLCGRLMCCLKYEHDTYESTRKLMPRVGRDYITPDGRGQVLENNVITEKTRMRVTLDDGTYDVRDYPYAELTKAAELTAAEKEQQLNDQAARLAAKEAAAAARATADAARAARAAKRGVSTRQGTNASKAAAISAVPLQPLKQQTDKRPASRRDMRSKADKQQNLPQASPDNTDNISVVVPQEAIDQTNA